MSWKTLEKSGLEPTAPNRLADRKHCALSTQPNPHVDGDLAESIMLLCQFSAKLEIFPQLEIQDGNVYDILLPSLFLLMQGKNQMYAIKKRLCLPVPKVWFQLVLGWVWWVAQVNL